MPASLLMPHSSLTRLHPPDILRRKCEFGTGGTSVTFTTPESTLRMLVLSHVGSHWISCFSSSGWSLGPSWMAAFQTHNSAATGKAIQKVYPVGREFSKNCIYTIIITAWYHVCGARHGEMFIANMFWSGLGIYTLKNQLLSAYCNEFWEMNTIA